MWRLYCRSSEGIAIQTTTGDLQDSIVPPCYLLPVGYHPESDSYANPYAIVTQKRPMFGYEREIRVVWIKQDGLNSSGQNPPGHTIAWDPAKHVRSILVHPESDSSFMETVQQTVRGFAPSLESVVRRSDMATPPYEVLGLRWPPAPHQTRDS